MVGSFEQVRLLVDAGYKVLGMCVTLAHRTVIIAKAIA